MIWWNHLNKLTSDNGVDREKEVKMDTKKRGLILEGGAMRGMFTCGVIDVLMENGIEFDGAIGVSAGAAFGCNYKSRQIGRPIRYNKRFCNDKRYVGLRSLLTTGNLYNVAFGYGEVPEKLDVFDHETFRENPMAFHVVCTDADSGKPVYHKCVNGDRLDIKWIRASASMPMVSRVVEIEDYKLLDGGISDAVPIRYFEQIGYDHNVVVLTQPMGYVKEKMKFLPLVKMALLKYGRTFKAMQVRHLMYNETIDYIRKKESLGDLFVICPSETLDIGKVEKNPEELERVYQLGRAEALKRLAELKAYMAENRMVEVG